MATLSEAAAAQSAALTAAYKRQQNRQAARIAALVALYYSQRVDPSSIESVESWLDLVIPRLIRTSDAGANDAATFFTALRRLELPAAEPFRADPAVGVVDAGVRKSLLTVGPYSYENKMRQIDRLDIAPQQREAMVRQAKKDTTTKLAGAAIRHAQAGGRETIYRNAEQDPVALGWVRVTRANPCFFCQALASRGLNYRAFKEGSFDLSDARFTGDGNAKVHDNCGCSLKPVYTTNDPLVAKTETARDQWSMWGAGGGPDAMLRFRRGYEHLQKTGEYLTWDQANEGLRAA